MDRINVIQKPKTLMAQGKKINIGNVGMTYQKV